MPAPRRETKLGSFAPDEPALSPPAAPTEPDARSVTEVMTSVRRRLYDDPTLARIWVRGEISNLTLHSSGHWYFSLKDDQSSLSAVMWRTSNARVKFTPEEGMEVLARGRIDVYPQRSTLQIAVDELRPVGAGELALRFEQLKRRLDAEGLFAPARKRRLPQFPRAIGVVTSLEGAALRDMVHVATSRHPGIRVLVAGARVQGPGAAEDVARAIARLNARDDLDVLIVGRGGGSIEDLWAFNEEVLVRAVASSRIPVVSAVGHETDYTLCDFAADLRAATPSHACEVVVPDAAGLRRQLDHADTRMKSALERLVPTTRQRLDDLLARAGDAVRRSIVRERDRIGAHAARLDALSPLAVLARGYAVMKKDGRTVRSVGDAAPGDDVTLVVQDGEIDAKVTRKRDKDG